MPTLLDCTIRDGSYAIDFKFTAADTALIAGALDAAGLRWIEVGHGLGLGASAAGKGRAGSQDLEVVARTREQVQHARIGAFFIPGIGREQDLRDAAAAGLDFVRIGHDADTLDRVLPFVDVARAAGLDVFVNAMKTYGVPPAEFARGAAAAQGAGAIGAYVVDSAGGMLPAEVAAYVTAARSESTLPIGFHGHSNLHLAVANSLAAHEAGAELIDTSVYGIGRSSGNVPTEVMASVFAALGIDCGVDPLAVINLAEAYLTPLAEHLHPHDMVAVALGLGRFHSSFLPAALAAAEEAQVNPFRLIVALGRRDPMRMSDDDLAAAIAELREHGARPEVRRELAQFSHPGFGPRRIRNRPTAVGELLDGLEVVAAKRRLTVVLDLVHAPALDDDAVTAEFVLEDEDMALGRLRYGTPDALGAALAAEAARIGLALVALPAEAGAAAAATTALDGRVVAYDPAALELERLGDVALAVWAMAPGSAFVVDALDGDTRALQARLTAAAPVLREAGDRPVVHVAAGAVIMPGDRTIACDRAEILRDTLPRWQRALGLAHPTAAPAIG
jgi:4-hydroxy 2-oxovalerate aldolase